jgi:hypothetical protein
LPDLAKAAEDRQQTTTNAGNHFPLLLFLPTNTPKVILMNRERERGEAGNLCELTLNLSRKLQTLLGNKAKKVSVFRETTKKPDEGTQK